MSALLAMKLRDTEVEECGLNADNVYHSKAEQV